MALGVPIDSRPGRRAFRGARPCALIALAMSSASCVPSFVETAPAAALPPPLPAAAPAESAGLTAAFVPAVATDAADFAEAFRGRTPLDRLRALDCLAQAIYYEAASESEDGQRAVAQVVLNRVRHPAWPDSVCGVVYQGPLREGGGCQFTFTCDGSLTRRAAGIAWARARLLAAEALAGRSYAPVGTSTHYHTFEVSPHWAPGLERTVAIGAHRFYRLPGRWGEGGAFTAAYAGSEPFPRPSMTLVRPRAAAPGLAALLAPSRAAGAPVAPPSDIPHDPRWTASDLPQSTVREEYRHSGQWRADAPASITGRQDR